MKFATCLLAVILPVSFANAKIPDQAALVYAYPKWSKIFKDPETKIPELFKNKDWKVISSMVNAKDARINRFLFKDLYMVPATGVQRSLQELMITGGDAETHYDLAGFFGRSGKAKKIAYAIRLLIAAGDEETLRRLVDDLFTGDGWDMIDEIRLVIERNDSIALNNLENAFRLTYPSETMPERIILNFSLEHTDPALRDAWIESEFQKIKSPYSRKELQRKADCQSALVGAAG